MKSVSRAFFVDEGNSLITIVSNRVEKHKLTSHKSGDVQAEKLWTTKIKYCVYVVEVPDAKRLVATDTSGVHYGLCSNTGRILWQTKAIGEGDTGVIIKLKNHLFRTCDGFVFATWSGVLQKIDTKTGKDFAKPSKFGFQFRDLVLAPTGNDFWVTCIMPAKSEMDQVGITLQVLNARSKTLIEIIPTTFCQRFMVSPDGLKVLSVYIVDTGKVMNGHPAECWKIKDLETGETICKRTFEPREFLSDQAVWSPDSKRIATANKAEHILMRTSSLETIATVAGKNPSRPAFHPSGRHICLCRANNTKVVPINSLEGQ